MTSTTLPTRRKALKLFAGVPLLPLGASGAAAFLAGCGGGSDDEQAQFAAAAFTSMAAPTLANPGAMATTSVGSALKVTMSDQSVRSFDLAYQPFFITGDTVPDGKGGTMLAGGYYDIRNQPIVDRTVPLGGLEEFTPPIVYIPGLSRQQLRAGLRSRAATRSGSVERPRQAS